MAVFCLLVVVYGIHAQDTADLIETYRRNFARSSLGTKYELLKDASGGQEMGPLYETALQFVLSNTPLLMSDTVIRDIAILSASQIQKENYTAAADTVWSIFKVFKDNSVSVAMLNALGNIAGGRVSLIQELNQYVEAQVALYKSSVPPEHVVLEAAVNALGKLGDESSFTALFSVYITGISKSISDKASTAMGQLNGNYLEFLASMIRNSSPQEKLAALEAGLKQGALSPEQRSELAEIALNIGLSQSPGISTQAPITNLRIISARELAASKWQKASPLAVRHFYDFQAQFNRGQMSKSNFLEAIALLGAMGTNEAAQALSLYLQLINTETEQGKTYDEQISLAVINNLGTLGDKSAFDHLLYVGYLQYPETVKRAARDALQKLNW